MLTNCSVLQWRVCYHSTSNIEAAFTAVMPLIHISAAQCGVSVLLATTDNQHAVDNPHHSVGSATKE